MKEISIIIFLLLWNLDNPSAQTVNSPGSGNCLNFDGLDDYINIPYSPGLQPTSITIEAWIKPYSLENYDGIVYHRNAAFSNWMAWGLWYNADGSITFQTEGNGINVNALNSPANSVKIGSWQHIAVVYDEITTNKYIYLNGILVANNTYGHQLFYGGNFDTQISRSMNNRSFSSYGQIDEVRIWNRALTQTEIQQNMCRKLPDNYGNGLVGYWRFDEGMDNTCAGGQDVCDASGNGNHGVKF